MKKQLALIPILLLLFTAIVVPIPVVAEEQGQGEATVGNATPTLTSREILTTPGGANQTGTITMAQTYVYCNVTVSDSNTLEDIANVSIYLFADTDATLGVFEKNESYGFQWYNNSGTQTWYELTGSGWVSSETYIDNSTSAIPTLTGSSGEWMFNITLHGVANNYQSNNWRYNATVIDSASASDDLDGGAYYDVAYYKDFTVESATVTWTGLSAGNINITAGTPDGGNNSMTVVAINHQSNIQIKGNGSLGGGPTSYPLDNVYVGQTDTASNNDGKELTVSYQTLHADVPKATESSDYDQYYFISVPDPCVPDTYVFTWYNEIVTT